jgi:glycosyltransferase involved in cell wall biosynthesis
MNILLVGEYSGVHITLAKALRGKGHNVTLLSDGDSYKGFEKDFSIPYVTSKNYLFRKLLIIGDLLGIKGLLQYWRNVKLVQTLKEFDVVQIINPVALEGYGSIANLFFLRWLKRNNARIFLCALGDDYYWVKAALGREYRYSAMDNLSLHHIKPYLYPLKYRYGLFYHLLNRYAVNISQNVIPGLYDYYVAYSWHPKCTPVLPLPISDSRIAIKPTQCTRYPVKIFHGWQVGKEARKGNEIFHEALLLLKENYGDKIEYEVARSLQYDEYIRRFSDCHIFLDQCYSYDAGMNGLLGMAAGKVTFTGVESEIYEILEGEHQDHAINALPEVKYIYRTIADLIENPDKIEQISRAALNYVTERHSSESVAEKYLDVWFDEHYTTSQ